MEENLHQTIILELCLKIMNEGLEDADVSKLATAINDYMMIVPEYCDLSIPLFVSHIYNNIILDTSKTGLPLCSKNQSIVFDSFLYRILQQEMVKMYDTCGPNSNPNGCGCGPNGGPSRNGNCNGKPYAKKLFETYYNIAQPLRMQETNRRDGIKQLYGDWEDPIIERKARDLFNYRSRFADSNIEESVKHERERATAEREEKIKYNQSFMEKK